MQSIYPIQLNVQIKSRQSQIVQILQAYEAYPSQLSLVVLFWQIATLGRNGKKTGRYIVVMELSHTENFLQYIQHVEYTIKIYALYNKMSTKTSNMHYSIKTKHALTKYKHYKSEYIK